MCQHKALFDIPHTHAHTGARTLMADELTGLSVPSLIGAVFWQHQHSAHTLQRSEITPLGSILGIVIAD